MDIVFQFLKDYKEYVLLAFSLLLVILDLMILIFKKRPTTIDDFESCLSDVFSFLPSLILKVEEPGNGAAKKAKVIDAAIKILKSKLGRDLSVRESSFSREAFSGQIEMILSTPIKKGESDAKKIQSKSQKG